MNTAQLKGLRDLHAAYITIVPSDGGFDILRNGTLIGRTKTKDGALELGKVFLREFCGIRD